MRRLAAVLLVLLLGGACSSKKDASSANATSTTGDTSLATTTSTSAATGGGGGGTSTTAKAGSSRLTLPDQAAAHLFLAWKAGNRAEAAQPAYATDAAVNSLFAHPYAAPEPTFEGCELQVDHYNCGYRGAGSAIVFRVEGTTSAGYRVTAVDFIAE